MKYLPWLLTFIRLLLGPVIIMIAFVGGGPGLVFLPLLSAGILTDYFDGVLAGKWGVATPGLRRFDSATDLVFYLCVLAATCLVQIQVMTAAWPQITSVIALEALCLGVSLGKFGKLPATHTYLAKAYGLVTFMVFAGVLCFSAGPGAFTILLIFAALANAEIVAILLLSEKAPVDVLSLAHLRPAKREMRPPTVA